MRVFAEYNDLKPADFKDGRSFFVTDDMIQNPSDKLFRGKHELIGRPPYMPHILYTAFSDSRFVATVLLQSFNALQVK